jgi:MFS family permease
VSTTAPFKRTSLGTVLASLVTLEVFSGVLQIYFAPLDAPLGVKFHVSIGTLSWALTAFSLSAVVFTPVLGRLGDLYGHRKVLKIEASLVAVGCVLVAVAPNFGVLVVGRVLEGSFAAYLPLMFGLVRSRYSDDDVRRAVAYLTSVLFFGVVVGLLAIGALVKTAGNESWALWLPAIGTIAGSLLLWIVPNESGHRGTSPRTMDWPGAALVAIGVVAVVLALTEGAGWGWASPRIIGLFVLGILALAGWVATELRTAAPLADVRYLFHPRLAPVFAIGFFVNFATLGSQVAVATLMELPHSLMGYGFSLTPWGFSVCFSLMYCFTFAAAAFTARLGKAIGFKAVMVTGCALIAVGYGGLCLVVGTFAGFLIFLFVAGTGLGFIEGSTRTVLVVQLRDGEVAAGEGIFELAITAGAAVGAAVLGTVLAGNSVPHEAFATLAGYRSAYLWTGASGLVALTFAVIYLLARQSPGKEQKASSQPPPVTAPEAAPEL